MKFFKVLLSGLLFIAALSVWANNTSAQELALKPVEVDADCKPTQNAYILKNDVGENGKSKITLTYDISRFPLHQTAHAALRLSGKNVGAAGADKLFSTVLVHYKGKLVGSCVLSQSTNPPDITLFVTDAVNDALKVGDGKINLVLSFSGIAGKTRQYQIDEPLPTLAIVAEVVEPYNLVEYIRPIWKAGKMTNEAAFMMTPAEQPDGGEAAEAEATLLFKPTKILSVRNGNLNETYEEGKDFIIRGNRIIATPKTRMPVFTYDQVFPKTKDNQPMKLFNFTPIKRFAITDEGNWFNRNQVNVTYTHNGEGWKGAKFGEKFDETLLPSTLKLLKSGMPVKIILFGDSISTGANSSGKVSERPYMPGFGDLVARALKDYYKNPNIQFINASRGGATVDWGVNHAEHLVANEKPDLVIVAFGMNHSNPPDIHGQKILEIMDRAKKGNPNMEFILVSPMQKNVQLRGTLEPYCYYPAVHEGFKKTGIATADVFGAHTEVLRSKKYLDTTGNHVNHPNDYMLRIYAQCILANLMPLEY